MSKKQKLSPKGLEKLAKVFKVLGESGRLTLLQELKEGSQTVGELVEATGLGQATVSKNLKMMHDAGLLNRQKDGVRVSYEVGDAMVFELCELVCGKLAREKDSLAEIDYFI